ncbi:hypothetical protein CRUP_036122, partial [Coryphaenoides rupestris]
MVVLECRCCELPDSQQFIPLVHRNDTKEDVFVHQTSIKKNNPRKFLRSVGDGEVVEFDVIEAPKGSEAANVTGPGGVPVKGSRYAPNKRRFRRRFFPRSPPPEDQDKAADVQGPPSEGEGGERGRPENETARPVPRRRGPRRPRQEGEVGSTGSEIAEGDQPRPQRRRFRPPFRRQFRPRPPTEEQGEEGGQQQQQQQPAAPPVDSNQPPDAKPPEDPQSDEELSDGQCRRHPRQAVRRMQRNSESSASKPANLKSSPKSSPKTTKSPEFPWQRSDSWERTSVVVPMERAPFLNPGPRVDRTGGPGPLHNTCTTFPSPSLHTACLPNVPGVLLLFTHPPPAPPSV